MDVILLQDLEGIGAKGSVVHVKPGYARNFLLPRKLAILAGERAANLFQELERQRQGREEKALVEARAAAAKLDGVEVNIPAPANEEDTLFGSITNQDVADALEKAGHTVDRHTIELDQHIKQLGRYEVKVRFRGGVSATVKLWVVRA